MNNKRAVLGLLAFALGAWALPASAITWAEADAKCKGNGSDCCAVAGADGQPKYREGQLVCSCGSAMSASANLSLAMRKQLAKDTAHIKEVAEKASAVPQSVLPLEKTKRVDGSSLKPH